MEKSFILTQLLSHPELVNYYPTKENDELEKLADGLIKDHKNISMETIVDDVCDYFHAEKDCIKIKTRKREIVRVRQWICFFGKTLTKDSLNKIATFISEKEIPAFNHATVLLSIRTIGNLVDAYPEERKTMQDISHRLLNIDFVPVPAAIRPYKIHTSNAKVDIPLINASINIPYKVPEGSKFAKFAMAE